MKKGGGNKNDWEWKRGKIREKRNEIKERERKIKVMGGGEG